MFSIENYRHIEGRFVNCDSDIVHDSKLLGIYARKAVKEFLQKEVLSSFFLFNPSGTTFLVLFNTGQLTLTSDKDSNLIIVELFIPPNSTSCYSFFDYLNKNIKPITCEIKEIIKPLDFNYRYD